MKIVIHLIILTCFILRGSYKDFENYLLVDRFAEAITYTKLFPNTPPSQRFTRYIEVILKKAALHQLTLAYYKQHERYLLDILTLEEFYYVTYGVWPQFKNIPKSAINKAEVIDYYHELFFALEHDMDLYYHHGNYEESLAQASSLIDRTLQRLYTFHKDDPQNAFLVRTIERIALKILAKLPQTQWFTFSKADLYYILFNKVIINDPTHSKYSLERLQQSYQQQLKQLQQSATACSTTHSHTGDAS